MKVFPCKIPELVHSTHEIKIVITLMVVFFFRLFEGRNMIMLAASFNP